jgi:membrane-bound ClpP family serine protease
MKVTLITIGIILLVLGIIGLVVKYSVTWMWVLVVLGLIGIVWGWLTKPEVK